MQLKTPQLAAFFPDNVYYQERFIGVFWGPAELIERKSYLLGGCVEDLEASLKACVSWANDCVRDVLYPLSHEATKLGAVAEGLGGRSVVIIQKAKDALEAPRPE